MKRILKIIFNKVYIAVLSIILMLAACNKENSWLDVKQNKNTVVPSTLNDFQAILDNEYTMNESFPGIGLVGTDNYYLSDDNFNSTSPVDRNAYIWAKDIYQGQNSDDWQTAYKVIEYTNIVLEGLKDIAQTSANQEEYNNVSGSTLFYQAYSYYTLAQDFCKPFDSTTAKSDLGLPIRKTSDINVKSTRATVFQTYAKIINDLKESVVLLPVTPKVTMRPSAVAARALLAKVYLSMGEYDDAEKYADSVLNEYNTLLDYNSALVSANSTFIFPPYPNNPEIIFYAYQNGYAETFPYGAGGIGYVDTTLYNSYDNNDLRKSLFYTSNGTGQIQFAGTYTGTFYNFCGIATDEIYLIRAECLAREGNYEGAMADINTLLSKRYITGTFQPLTADNADEALRIVLNERRKELPFRGQLRWEDLRRLNQDKRFEVTLKRIIDGQVYTLPPNDDRYVYPIPDVEIQYSNIQQNPR